ESPWPLFPWWRYRFEVLNIRFRLRWHLARLLFFPNSFPIVLPRWFLVDLKVLLLHLRFGLDPLGCCRSGRCWYRRLFAYNLSLDRCYLPCFAADGNGDSLG